LFHDMGEAIILGVIGDSWRNRGIAVPSLELLAPVIEHYHAQSGGVVCRKWGMQDIIAESVRFHHQPKLAAHCEKMAMALNVTDLLLGHAGIGCERALVDPINQPLFFELNLSPGQALHLIDYANYLGENRGDWSV
ncbi:MAG: HDOD domain-containing protein, partial [Myxococcota bacterium]|nr:HDOD domain-containing protein [Myxococcota bacterium]